PDKRANVVDSPENCDYIIVFCPIVSRFQTDVNAALSDISDQQRKLIVVAMHHTFDPNYTLPDTRQMDNKSVKLLVDCLFHETKGFYKCARNTKARKSVCKKVITQVNILHLTIPVGSNSTCEDNTSLTLRPRETLSNSFLDFFSCKKKEIS
uniref:Uncharacterized protein n=1 Tax=Acanthochromis polyacanthus TaxID=80966 RepID=A0A3Q1GLE2_9TELE